MKYRFLIIVFGILLMSSASSYGQIASWDFAGNNTAVPNFAATFYHPFLDSSNLVTRGSAVSGAAATAANNSFRTTGFQNNGIATTNTDYFEVTLSVQSPYTLSLTTIDARLAGTNTFAASPGVTSQFAYSLDGTTFTLIGSPQITVGSPATLTQIDLTGIAALQNLADTVTVYIRYYASGQTATGGWGFNSTAGLGNPGLSIGANITSACTPPATPAGTSITGTTPACNSTTLTYTGAAPPVNVINYWQFNTTTGTITTNNAASPLTVSASGNYYVRAKNTATGCWSANSYGPYAVVINAGPTITTQPSNISVPANTNATFSVVAANPGTYQWQESTDGGITYTNLANGGVYSGVTTANLTLTMVPIGMNGYKYQCVVSAVSPCTIPISSSAVLLTVTTASVFSEGDFAVLGINSNMNPGSPAPVCTYTGTNAPYTAGDDEISFITFKDIQNGDVFYITDNGYERSFTGLWGETEGVYQFTRSGGTILAGTVITFRFLNVSPFMEFVSPDTSWTFSKAAGFTSQVNTNSGGDQIFFMQGGTWTNPATTTHDATYTGGTLLYAFNTGTTWTSLGNSTQQSALPLALRCFNMMPGVAADYIEYTGVTTPASKYDWIVRLNDPTNWTNRANCVSYTRMHVGQTYGVINGSYVNGVWTGSKSTDWFDCGNWQTLKVPVATTDVSVNATYATKDAVIDVVANSTNAALYSNQATCNNITVSSRKVQLEASASNTLDVKGNLTISGSGAIDMDDSNSTTADGRINLYGNWTNTVGNTAFLEGNGTVNFTGTGTQIINNVTPEGTETFYDVILNNNFDTALSNDLIASNTLTVNASKTFSIDSAGYARANNKLSNNGNVVIENGGQLIQVNDIDTNDGDYSATKFQVKKIAQAKDTDYIYWSSPISSFATTSLPTDYRYIWNTAYNNTNGTQGNWNPTPGGSMTIGKGYIARASNGASSATAFPVTFTGSKPNNGLFNFAVYRGNYSGSDYDADVTDPNNVLTTKYDDNWNLVGNPYPSAIDAEKFLVLNQTVIEGSVWIWKHGLLPNSIISPFYSNFLYNYSDSDYIKYNGLGSSDPDTFAGKIASGQGFMVSMKDVGSLFATGSSATLNVYSSSINFNNSLRSDSTTNPYMPYNNTDFYKTSSAASSLIGTPVEEEKHRIWLDIIDNTTNQSDVMLVGYSTNSTLGRDNLYDCFFIPRGEVSLYSLINEDSFVIQGRPLPFNSNDKVPLGINIASQGNHTITIKKVDGLFTEGIPIYLEDKVLNVIHDLRETPYVFTSEKGKFNNRFVLRYTNESLVNPDFNSINNSVVVATNHGQLTIKSTIEMMKEVLVYDVLGRELFKKDTINSNEFTATNISMSHQTLIVKITLEDGTMLTRKIIL